MLAAAFAAAAMAAVTGSAWLGLGAGIAAAVLVSLVHGFACITHHGNQVVSGMALNITLSGLRRCSATPGSSEGGQTPLLGAGRALRPDRAAGRRGARAGAGDRPDLRRGRERPQPARLPRGGGRCPRSAWLVYRTRFGLRLRAVGENPARGRHRRHLGGGDALPARSS